MTELQIVKLLIVSLVILPTAYHEAAHAYVATYFGDPTPGRYGRLTLNPIPHLKPVITAIVLPLFMFMTSGGFMIMAQTPVDPSRFRHPLRDHALVALAGPVTNLLFAALFIGVLWIPGVWRYDGTTISMPMAVLPWAALLNIIMAIFNMLPFPPLDGYWIARSLLPLQFRRETDKIARNQFSLILCVLVGSYIVGHWYPTIEGWMVYLLPDHP
ncbi:MAG TPA: site-2 protease family protein [Planctomycetota bacterium]|nr:site-2 protease family protein [Planctomycetota bacterium]